LGVLCCNLPHQVSVVLNDRIDRYQRDSYWVSKALTFVLR
jgi:hypothetical protein